MTSGSRLLRIVTTVRSALAVVRGSAGSSASRSSSATSRACRCGARQRIAHLVEDAAHEVAEGSEREVGLGLGWPNLEHPIASLTGRANRLEHDGRLADAGLALDQEPDGPAWHLLREPSNRRRLARASDHVDHRCTLDVAVNVRRHPSWQSESVKLHPLSLGVPLGWPLRSGGQAPEADALSTELQARGPR